MAWLFRRLFRPAGATAEAVPSAARASGVDWAAVPPIQRIADGITLTAEALQFVRSRAGLHPPELALRSLGHERSLRAPAGLIRGVATNVQRRVTTHPMLLGRLRRQPAARWAAPAEEEHDLHTDAGLDSSPVVELPPPAAPRRVSAVPSEARQTPAVGRLTSISWAESTGGVEPLAKHESQSGAKSTGAGIVQGLMPRYEDTAEPVTVQPTAAATSSRAAAMPRASVALRRNLGQSRRLGLGPPLGSTIQRSLDAGVEAGAPPPPAVGMTGGAHLADPRPVDKANPASSVDDLTQAPPSLPPVELAAPIVRVQRRASGGRPTNPIQPRETPPTGQPFQEHSSPPQMPSPRPQSSDPDTAAPSLPPVPHPRRHIEQSSPISPPAVRAHVIEAGGVVQRSHSGLGMDLARRTDVVAPLAGVAPLTVGKPLTSRIAPAASTESNRMPEPYNLQPAAPLETAVYPLAEFETGSGSWRAVPPAGAFTFPSNLAAMGGAIPRSAGGHAVLPMPRWSGSRPDSGASWFSAPSVQARSEISEQWTTPGAQASSAHGRTPLFVATALPATDRSPQPLLQRQLTDESAPATDQAIAEAQPMNEAAVEQVRSNNEMEELSKQLYERVRSRIRAELLIDRERAGLVTDLR